MGLAETDPCADPFFGKQDFVVNQNLKGALYGQGGSGELLLEPGPRRQFVARFPDPAADPFPDIGENLPAFDRIASFRFDCLRDHHLLRMDSFFLLHYILYQKM